MKTLIGRGVFKHPLIRGMVLGLLLGGGAAGAEWRAKAVDADMREALLRQTIEIAQTVDPELASRLTFTSADREAPTFQLLREQLTAYGGVIRPRGIYTLALREGVLVFGPETYADDDPMASPPGTVYEEPSPEVFEVLDGGQPTTHGPATDEYGTFISALAPVIAPQTGEVLMLVGVDITDDTWRANVNVVRRVPWAVAGALALVYLGLTGATMWRDSHNTRHMPWLKHIEAATVALLGLAMTVVAGLILHEIERREQTYVFTAVSTAQVRAVSNALYAVKDDVAAVARFYSSSPDVSCDEFTVFAEPLASTQAIRRYQWIDFVRADDIAAFETIARNEGLDRYQVWEEDGSGERVPVSGREVVYPVRCAAPRADNLAIAGFDVGSDPNLRSALEAASRTGLATASDAYPLNRPGGDELGVLVVLPVYTSTATSDSAGSDPDTQSPIGFVAAEIRLQPLLDLALRPYIERGSLVGVHLDDLMDGGGSLLLAAHPGGLAENYPDLTVQPPSEPYGTSRMHPLFVFGQTWVLATHATQALNATTLLRSSWVTIASGALVTVIGVVLVGSLRNREAKTEAQVRLRTAELREREQDTVTTLNSIGDAVIATDVRGQITRMNPIAEQLTGWTLARGRLLAEVFPTVAVDTHEPLEDPVSRVLSTGTVMILSSHTALIARDGTERPIAGSAAPIRDTDGCILGTVLAFHDITARVSAEKVTLRQLKELTLLHAVATACAQAADQDELIADLTHSIGEAFYPDNFGFLMADETGSLYPHPSYHQHTGTPIGIIRPGQGIVGQVAAERRALRVDDSQLDAGFIQAFPTSRSELAVPVMIGERLITVINAESPEVGHFSAEDERLLVTVAGQLASALERLHLEQQTRRRLVELEALHSTSQEIIAAGVDTERVYATMHRVVARLMPAEAFAIVMRDPVHGDNEVVYAIDEGGHAPYMRVSADQGVSGYVISHGEALLMDDLNPRSDIEPVHFGSPQSVHSYLAVPLRVNEQVIGMLSAQSYSPVAYTPHDRVLLETLANHVAAALQNIRLLQQSQEQVQHIQAILDSVPEGVLLLDAAGHIVLANPVAARDLGMLVEADADATVVRLAGRPLAELLTSPPEGLWHELKYGERTFEVTPRPVTSGPEPESYVMVISDVTHERQVRTEMERQERLAAVGQLAAGIAHDFNNILAIIVLYAQMALRDRSLPDHLRTYIQTMSDQAHHATNLVQQILDFGRRAMLDRQSIDLVTFVKEQAALLSRTLPENIRIETAYSVDTVDISADATRLQQLLTNLAVNARDAMPEGGVLRFDVTRLRLDQGRSMPLHEMTPGLWARVVVSDTGNGMPPNIAAHVFEPFFTTKEPGKGTGLGLAQVYGIVKQHNGHIGVESEIGRGTTFTVYLPALEQSSPAVKPDAAVSHSQGQGQVILVVEDNTSVRQALVSTLDLLGYRTVEAANGREALSVLDGRVEGIALVLTDLVMPEMGGQSLLNAIRARGLTLPVIFLSGHPVRDDVLDLQDHGLFGWLNKPPDIDALADMLARALS